MNSGNAKSSARKNLVLTKDELIDLHWVRGLSLTEIGKMRGVTVQAIKYWCNKLEVEHRSQVKAVIFEPNPALSYIIGCLHGDAFIHNDPKYYRNIITMSVIDVPFAEAMSRALMAIGLNPHITNVKARGNDQPQFKVYAHSKDFVELWTAMSGAERFDLALAYPAEFIRGVYDSEGTVSLHRGSLELRIGTTNIKLKDVLVDQLIQMGLTPKVAHRILPSAKDFYVVALWRSLEVKKFMAHIMPNIKLQPRQVNPEPSLSRDIQEGAETMKATRTVVE